MSSVNEILYVTARSEIAAKIKNLKNIAEIAVKKGEHVQTKDGGAKAIELLDKASALIAETDKIFEGIVYLSTSKKGKD